MPDESVTQEQANDATSVDTGVFGDETTWSATAVTDGLQKESDKTKDFMPQPVPVVEIEGPPIGPTSWEELDAAKEAQEKAISLQQIADQFQIMQRDVFKSDIEDKGAAIEALSAGLSARLNEVEKVKAAEMDEKAVWSTKFVNDLPDSSFLYIEKGGEKEAGKTTPRSLRHFPYKDASGTVDLPHLRNAIARIPQSNAPGLNKSALQAKARKMLADTQKEKPGLVDRAVERVKSVFKKDDPPPQSRFMLWKEADGQYRWFAVYSNNYRDDDRPAEIISEQSHRDYVKAVDSDEWPMPELWAWHVPGSRWGVADFVAYDDDTGFALAAGTVDKGQEHVAEAVAVRDDLLVSHGMPRSEIKHDPGDPTTLIRHRTKEISPLPANRAANKFTGFITLEKEANVNIPKDKMEFLQEIGLDPDTIQAALETQKAKLDTAGVESKEAEDAPVEAAPEAAVIPAAVQAITAEDIGTAIATALGPIMTELVAQKDRIDDLVKQATTPEPEPVTPLESIMLAVKSGVIGQPEARVDGRTKEAKDGPVETATANPRNKLHGFPGIGDPINAIFNGQLVKEVNELQGVQ